MVANKLSSLGLPSDIASRAERFGRAAASGEMADVARSSERDLSAVLDAYGVVEEGLSVATLEGVLSRQGAAERWDRWQLDLLADDVARARAEAAIRALRSYPDEPGGPAGRQWLAAHSALLARPLRLVRELGGSTAPPLSLLTLAVRALGEAVRA